MVYHTLFCTIAYAHNAQTDESVDSRRLNSSTIILYDDNNGDSGESVHIHRPSETFLFLHLKHV